MQSQLQNERNAFVSAKPAGRREVRFAIGAVLVSAAIFCAAAPFATMQFAHVPAFIPAYQAALVISDLITAVLLFGQFNFLRSRALLVLASGYLFTAFIAFSHAHSPAAPYVSVSCGVAVLLHQIDMSAEQLVAAADQSLYQAKQRGRNQLVCMQAERENEHA